MNLKLKLYKFKKIDCPPTLHMQGRCLKLTSFDSPCLHTSIQNYKHVQLNKLMQVLYAEDNNIVLLSFKNNKQLVDVLQFSNA